MTGIILYTYGAISIVCVLLGAYLNWKRARKFELSSLAVLALAGPISYCAVAIYRLYRSKRNDG